MTSIENFENYVIFENGDIINVNTGKIKKPTIEKNGYLVILLHKNGKQKGFKLHRLLALAFIPNPENKECIDHINRIRTDNRLENLRWATQLENHQNMSIYKSNTSGHKNISWNDKEKKWRWRRIINGKNHSKRSKCLKDLIEFKNKFYLENNIVE